MFLAWLDRVQRKRHRLAFLIAVGRKFADDQAGSLAALIAYYGFLSVFPLLMVLVTITELMLRSRPGLRAMLLNSALAQFPVVGSRIRAAIAPVSGRGWVIVVGLAAAVWSGLAGVGAAQRALDDVWDVPRHRRPSFVRAQGRALLLLGLLGTFLVLTSITTAAVAALGSGPVPATVAVLCGAVLNTALALGAFRALTAVKVAWTALLPGAAVVRLHVGHPPGRRRPDRRSEAP